MKATLAFKEHPGPSKTWGSGPGPSGVFAAGVVPVLLRAPWCPHRRKPPRVVPQGITCHTAVRSPPFPSCPALLELPNGHRGVIEDKGAHGSIRNQIQSLLYTDWHTSSLGFNASNLITAPGRPRQSCRCRKLFIELLFPLYPGSLPADPCQSTPSAGCHGN